MKMKFRFGPNTPQARHDKIIKFRTLLMCTAEFSKRSQFRHIRASPHRHCRVWYYLPTHAITFLKKVINAVLCRKYFPPELKHVHMVSILKPGKDPTLRLPTHP